MYTRCPSCRAEISFEPPVNATSLPDGYKHKIKCPSCGVTIAVKIPRLESTPQPVLATQAAPIAPVAPVETNNVANNYAEEYNNDTATDMAVAPKAKKKRFGGAANFFAMLWSLLLIGVFVVAHLCTKEIIPQHALIAGIDQFDAISHIISFFEPNAFKDAWSVVGLDIIWALIPAITFVFACIHFIVTFSCLCAGKYSKAYNVIWTLILFAGASLSLIYSIMLIASTGLIALAGVSATDLLKEFFKGMVDGGAWVTLCAAPGIGFIAFLTALCSLGVKNPNKRSKKARE